MLQWAILSLGLLSVALLVMYSYILDTQPKLSATKPPNLVHRKSFDLPAPAFNGKLFIWGARITMQSATEPYFEMLVQGHYHVKDDDIEYHNHLNRTILWDSQYSQYHLFCKTIDNHDVSNLTAKINYNRDFNAVVFIHRFLCPISLDLLEHDVLKIQVMSPQDGSIYLEIPRGNHSLGGLVGPTNPFPAIPLYKQPKVKYMLCSGGVFANGIKFLPEFLQHHIRVGFQHFMIGLDVDIGGEEMEQQAQELLKPLIDSGVVVLYSFRTPYKYIKVMDKGAWTKNVFNEACLSYAKGRSEYVANWDLDEFWMPNNADDITNGGVKVSLLDREVEERFQPADTCKDWCFITFPSYYIFGRPVHFEVKQIARDMPMRAPLLDYAWQKSLARTKNVFNSGPHCYGSCLFNGQRGTESDGKRNLCAQKTPHLGRMHHFRAMFYRDNHKSSEADLVPDEYSVWTMQLGGFAVDVKRVIGEEGTFRFNRVPEEKEFI